jgi:two-component system, response regulator FlrC
MPLNILLIQAKEQAEDTILRLADEKYNVLHCDKAREAFDIAAQSQPQVVLFDIAVVDMLAPVFISAFSRVYPSAPVIALVNSEQSKQASEAMQSGATDYLLKPFRSNQLESTIVRANCLQRPMANMVVAAAKSMQVIQLAHRSAQADATVLISGESGTGKEVLSRYIHDVSPRADGPFVAINCAAIPESMLEATLFGYNRGAYTGAINAQPGKFEVANGGTLLLDEISELPLALQSKLLRVIQEREVERLGGHQTIKLDVRLIAATNRDLREEVKNGRFRQDLYYRLDVLPLMWSALRERKEDILPLAQFFLEKYGQGQQCVLSPGAQASLYRYPWPGNVRELENIIQRSVVLARGVEIQAEDLMLPESDAIKLSQALPSGANTSSEGLNLARKEAEFEYVLDALRRFEGHRTRTAQALGVTTRALRYKLAAMRDQGIDVDHFVR